MILPKTCPRGLFVAGLILAASGACGADEAITADTNTLTPPTGVAVTTAPFADLVLRLCDATREFLDGAVFSRIEEDPITREAYDSFQSMFADALAQFGDEVAAVRASAPLALEEEIGALETTAGRFRRSIERLDYPEVDTDPTLTDLLDQLESVEDSLEQAGYVCP